MHILDMLQLDPSIRKPIPRSRPPTPGTGTQKAAPTLVHIVLLLLVEVQNLLRRKGLAGGYATCYLAAEGLEVLSDEFAVWLSVLHVSEFGTVEAHLKSALNTDGLCSQ